MLKRNIFYLILGILGAISGYFQWHLFQNAWLFLNESPWVFLFVLAPCLFVIPHTLSDYLPLWLEQLLGRVGGYYFFGAYYATLFLFPFCLAKILFLMPALAPWQTPFLTAYAQGAAAAIMFVLAAGYWRGHHSIVRRIDVTTNKPILREFTLAFASDIHLGPSIGPAFAKRMVADLNELQADLVLFGGDIIDGDLQTVLREHSLEALAGIKAVWGVYAVLGNHDHYGFDILLERQLLQEAGLTILSGKTVYPAEGVAITGVMDARYHTEEPVIPQVHEAFHIVMEHEPIHISEAANAKGDLYLAGHTHAGQFWPQRNLVRKVFPFDYGIEFVKQLTAIVTSGYGAWGARFRLGPAPEIVLVTVKKI